jgi:hypothetical protein
MLGRAVAEVPAPEHWPALQQKFPSAQTHPVKQYAPLLMQSPVFF